MFDRVRFDAFLLEPQIQIDATASGGELLDVLIAGIVVLLVPAIVCLFVELRRKV